MNGGTCSIDGCGKKAKSTGLCSMHYCRFWRYGSYERSRARVSSYIHTHGYVVEHAPGHFLANSANEVFQHRRVFFEANGEGPFSCHWCSSHLEWSTLHIDHLDDVKTNNVIDNLKPSCPTCNTARGAWKLNALYLQKYGIEYQGKRYRVAELAVIAGLTRQGMRKRLNVMSPDEAMSHKKYHKRPDEQTSTGNHQRCSKIRQARMRGEK